MATLAECLDFVAEVALAEVKRIAEERAAERNNEEFETTAFLERARPGAEQTGGHMDAEDNSLIDWKTR